MPLLTVNEQIPKGLREDLSDLIAVVDAKSKPLLALAKKGAELVNPDVHSWQADGYNAPSFAGVMAGDDVTAWDSPAAQRAKLSGRCQKFRRSIMVDDFAANISDVAGVGRKKEMARGAAKSIEELGRDIEAAFCSDSDSVQQTGASTPYRTRGLGSWIASAAQSDLPVPADYRSVAGAISTTATDSITEGSIQNILQAIYEQTGTVKNLVLLCGPTLKRRFTEFTRTQAGSANVALNVKTYNTPAADRKITSTVDVFEGDFGSLQLLPSLLLAQDGLAAVQSRRGYIIDPDMVEVRYGRRPAFRELEDRGGGPRGIIDAIAGLVVHSPRGLGKIASTAS
jgi:Family of unknown function (DUF5309)